LVQITKLYGLRGSSKQEETKYYEYFPLEPTIRKLLSIFRDFIGMDFSELTAGDQQYQSVASLYLEGSNVKERDAKLGPFLVHETRFNRKPLEYLVLDLEERDGKPRGALCKISLPYVLALSSRNHLLCVLT
jgi:hypothetical protein